MDWGYKAMVTATTIGLLLSLAQRIGHRATGAIAGLPMMAAPALLYLATEHGTTFVLRATTGAVLSCSVNAVFALTYAMCARRFGAIRSLLAASTSGAAVMLVLHANVNALPIAAGLALIACPCALMALRDDGVSFEVTTASGGLLAARIALAATVAGLISATLSSQAAALGSLWSGLLASMPIVATLCAVFLHVTAGAASVQRFYRGYLCGLIGQSGFGVALALGLPTLGLVPSFLLALAVASTVSLAATRAAAVLGIGVDDRANALAASAYRR